ncbi:MAG TPA: hypothetical protein VJ739_18505 [Gemmataceae bacterium]|nr:hypothetical protein [Gemmataceae bacterium]
MTPERQQRGLSRRQWLATAGTAVLTLGTPSAPGQAREQSAAAGFRFPATGVAVPGAALLLAIDSVSLPLKRNLCYYLSKPKVRKEPVLTPTRDKPDAPDALAAHFYGTVLHDGGKFRMWYYACHTGRNPDWSPEQQAVEKYYERYSKIFPGPLCYAESDDGISWTKPALRLLRFKGRLDHNALPLPESLISCATVVKDDADADPGRRYKIAYEYFDKNPRGQFWGTLRTAVSPDGLHWRVGDKLPIDAFIEFASFYKHQGLYLVNAHTYGDWQPGEGGSQRGRQGVVWVSPDFNGWLAESAESFLLPEPRRPADRGITKPYDQVHLGVGAASFGNVLVGLYGIWHNNPTFDKISCDLGLVVSNDGLAFREPVKGHVYLAAGESPVAAHFEKSYPTVLTQANGILEVGDETRIYHGRWRNSGDDEANYYGEVALATLPRDRWGALGLYPGAAEGSVWSTPVTLPPGGCNVLLNADAAGGMRVEVGDERFRLLPESSGKNAGICRQEGGLDCPVTWPTGNLAALGGKTVRLRVQVNRAGRAEPRLYAVSLKQKE